MLWRTGLLPESARVALEGVRAVAAIDVPDADAAVRAAAGQQPSRAVHRQIRHRRTVPLHTWHAVLALFSDL